ncbi:SANT/Myb-like DNA-binding domain-containing protein [Alicyclobacillus shizuokensis]|uniref:SANT/Myb-like DNA-binding domain-containing protein n=1 Tax=Alicyclobacillus shizuokensis TaxID=392014 RepID=UPI0014701D3B|nr:SANT/Myb-like DNA-binding domain-containing protein [Alicyclobacillus shizuokensis]
MYPINKNARWTEDEERWLEEFVQEQSLLGIDDAEIFSEASERLKRTPVSIRQHFNQMRRRRKRRETEMAEVMPIHVVNDSKETTEDLSQTPFMDLAGIIRALRQVDQDTKKLQQRNQKLEGMYKASERHVKALFEQQRVLEETIKAQAQRIYELETEAREISDEGVKDHPLYQSLVKDYRELKEKYDLMVKAFQMANSEMVAEPVTLKAEQNGNLVKAQ